MRRKCQPQVQRASLCNIKWCCSFLCCCVCVSLCVFAGLSARGGVCPHPPTPLGHAHFFCVRWTLSARWCVAATFVGVWCARGGVWPPRLWVCVVRAVACGRHVCGCVVWFYVLSSRWALSARGRVAATRPRALVGLWCVLWLFHSLDSQCAVACGPHEAMRACVAAFVGLSVRGGVWPPLGHAHGCAYRWFRSAQWRAVATRPRARMRTLWVRRWSLSARLFAAAAGPGHARMPVRQRLTNFTHVQTGQRRCGVSYRCTFGRAHK